MDQAHKGAQEWSLRVDDGSGELVGECVAGFVGFDVGVDGLSDEGDIADEVEEFVVGAFVLVVEHVADRPLVVEDEHLAGFEVLKQSGV